MVEGAEIKRSFLDKLNCILYIETTSHLIEFLQGRFEAPHTAVPEQGSDLQISPIPMKHGPVLSRGQHLHFSRAGPRVNFAARPFSFPPPFRLLSARSNTSASLTTNCARSLKLWQRSRFAHNDSNSDGDGDGDGTRNGCQRDNLAFGDYQIWRRQRGAPTRICHRLCLQRQHVEHSRDNPRNPRRLRPMYACAQLNWNRLDGLS